MASVAKRTTLPLAEVRLKTHFKDQQLHDLVTSSRTFPVTARVDVQVALERLFSGYPEAELLGLHNQYGHETLTIAHVLSK